jgi:hypothetical protein
VSAGMTDRSYFAKRTEVGTSAFQCPKKVSMLVFICIDHT